MNDQNVLTKLEWPVLLNHLSRYCQTQEAQKRSLELLPQLSLSQVKEKWGLVVPLRDLINQGYMPTIGDVQPVSELLRAATMGQILEAKDLLSIAGLLYSVRNAGQFLKDFAARCSTLEIFRVRLVPLPQLTKEITRAVDQDGQIKDDATPELLKLRNEKRSLKQKIEHKLQHLLANTPQYLQDQFFTVRLDRYVVPISIDGRGRFGGAIIDTSASGQTLYMEPTNIAPLNQDLQELELSEKLELIRILKKLTVEVAINADALNANYENLVELDFLSAQSKFAAMIGGNALELTEENGFNLVAAKHPLLSLQGKTPVANSIELKPNQRSLIISGPNAGGKTVVLKTIGLLQLMAKAGLLIPAAQHSTLFIYDQIFIEMGDSQDLSANLSTFSGHIAGLNRILTQAGESDLALLDELAVGTEPQTAAALAQSMIEHFTLKNITTIVTTHFDNLKLLATDNERYRNGSMEYSEKDYKPTYRLILDVPGQSYGLEVAKQMGLPASVLKRASELKGSQASALDQAIRKFSQATSEFEQSKREYTEKIHNAEAEKARWQQEVGLLAKRRETVAADLREKYEQQMQELQGQIKTIGSQIRHSVDKESQQSLQNSTAKVKSDLEQVNSELRNLASKMDQKQNLPGMPCKYNDLRLGDPVYVTSFKKEGTISRLNGPNEDIEVESGPLKFKVPLKVLRLLVKLSNVQPKSFVKNFAVVKTEISPVTIYNGQRVDVRGFTSEDALSHIWKAIDSAVMRGNDHVMIVHGHGTNSLKTSIRQALSSAKDYDLKYRAGDSSEGGDGVTIVSFLI